MVGDDVESDDSSDLPLDDSVYTTTEEDTMEKMKRGLKKFGKDMKKGAGDIADSSKKFAAKSKEKYEVSREERKKAKAMKEPLKFPWGTLSVPELKENLKGLGLKVSGKKDDLIERIMEHYRTDIPEMEDGTPHLIEDLEPVEETPAAPDIDELVKEEGEVVEELNPTFEEVGPETPVYQFSGSEQLYVPDPLEYSLKRIHKWKIRRINTSIRIISSLLMLILSLSIINYGFEMGLFKGSMSIFNDLLAERFTRSYGGMDGAQEATLTAVLGLIFCCSSCLFLYGNRQIFSALVAMFGLVISFSIRIYVALDVDAFENANVISLLIVDLISTIPFSFLCWVPAMICSSLAYDDQYGDETYYSDASSGVFVGPESIIDVVTDEKLGDELSSLMSTIPPRPLPPRRRQKGSYSLYEILFLLISLILWPTTLSMLVLFSMPGFITRFGSISSQSTVGMCILGIFFFASFACSYIVYRYENEARAGKEYAKEKDAYHETMDQWLEIRKAVYNKVAENVGINVQDDE